MKQENMWGQHQPTSNEGRHTMQCPSPKKYRRQKRSPPAEVFYTKGIRPAYVMIKPLVAPDWMTRMPPLETMLNVHPEVATEGHMSCCTPPPAPNSQTHTRRCCLYLPPPHCNGQRHTEAPLDLTTGAKAARKHLPGLTRFRLILSRISGTEQGQPDPHMFGAA